MQGLGFGVRVPGPSSVCVTSLDAQVYVSMYVGVCV